MRFRSDKNQNTEWLTKRRVTRVFQTMFWVRGDWLELTRSDITLQDKLGEGAFGEAYKGLVRVNGQWRQCAVKKLKGTCGNQYRGQLENRMVYLIPSSILNI